MVNRDWPSGRLQTRHESQDANLTRAHRLSPRGIIEVNPFVSSEALREVNFEDYTRWVWAELGFVQWVHLAHLCSFCWWTL